MVSYVINGSVYLQNVDSMPAYSPNGPSFLTICLTTSIGPLNVLVLSCSLIFMSNYDAADPRDSLDFHKFEWDDDKTLLKVGVVSG